MILVHVACVIYQFSQEDIFIMSVCSENKIRFIKIIYCQHDLVCSITPVFTFNCPFFHIKHYWGKKKEVNNVY